MTTAGRAGWALSCIPCFSRQQGHGFALPQGLLPPELAAPRGHPATLTADLLRQALHISSAVCPSAPYLRSPCRQESCLLSLQHLGQAQHTVGAPYTAGRKTQRQAVADRLGRTATPHTAILQWMARFLSSSLGQGTMGQQMS